MIATAVANAPYFGAAQADTFWLMLCGFLVFFMQCGFALLEAGTVRAKNTKNILLKNLLDACVGALGFWAVGYGISYGNKDNSDAVTFIGDEVRTPFAVPPELPSPSSPRSCAGTAVFAPRRRQF